MRQETEMIVSDTFKRLGENKQDRISLIRVNPDFPQCENELLVENDLVMSLRGTALDTLIKVDREWSAMEPN